VLKNLDISDKTGHFSKIQTLEGVIHTHEVNGSGLPVSTIQNNSCNRKGLQELFFIWAYGMGLNVRIKSASVCVHRGVQGIISELAVWLSVVCR